jgi:drug/metabolite transporter (DMT)-like permease
MSGLRQILFVLGLGMFWAASPVLNKLAGLAGVPVAYIVVASGFGVGLTLLALHWLSQTGLRLGSRELLFGLGCGILTNIPFVLGLNAIRHVPVAVMAVVTSTSPLWTYALALILGRERLSAFRLAALVVGLGSSLALILTRPGAGLGGVDGWMVVTLGLPVLWGVYNNFTSAAWPAGMPALTGGMVESFASGLLGLPLLLVLEQPAAGAVAMRSAGYWLLLAMILMWVLERICFFNMIKGLGPVTTVLATYVATPAAVLLGVLLFAETPDAWLWLSLGLLAAALWLNNRATRRQTVPAPAPEAA